ncbi:diguanylate cyclase [Sporosarcina oncorhynchi]|uniref:Diguanylate cyclase n=1 Tax=Sporosarcina oncorhynchi TaxID=3056444 RepID=A0ABZ0L829_9BACL|nr:diguanylate cyclase [Sporosarcina sp. T2O-4]WOV88717.1 diguanylate cyclase [Sporosarcina sp. T2O-4]
MAFNKTNLHLYFLLWLFIVPPGLLYAFFNFFPQTIEWDRFISFTILALLTSSILIKFNGKPVTWTMWVTMAVFLHYGLFIELVISQLTVFVFLIVQKSSIHVLKRYFINSTMLLIASFIAAISFYLVGGEVGTTVFWLALVSLAVYRLIYTIVNMTLVKLVLTAEGSPNYLSVRDVLYEYWNVVLLLPMALTLYFLLNIIGNAAFLLIGGTYLVIALLVRQYDKSEQVNTELALAGEIGSELTGLTDELKIRDQFLEEVNKLFDADYLYLFKSHDDWLEQVRAIEDNRFINNNFDPLPSGWGIAGKVFSTNKSILYSAKKEWNDVALYINDQDVESILCVPISHNDHVEYVLFLGSRRPNIFKEYQLQIVDLLSSYFTVSLDKAKYMQKALTQSEKCALTNLYNYKYLETKLSSDMKNYEQKKIQTLSAVMMDIDHFKRVNDTYGHECGNDILVAFARLLESEVPTGATVGRYGGEEFLFLLPDFDKSEALAFGESIRKKIKETTFEIVPDLDRERKPVNVSITASIGVSTVPDDTDEGMTLVRNADRALYIGAKQAGRDRVAEYIR